MVRDFIETIGTEVTSTLAPALAAANTVEIVHPFLSATIAYVEVFVGWGAGDSTGTSSTSGAVYFLFRTTLQMFQGSPRTRRLLRR